MTLADRYHNDDRIDFEARERLRDSKPQKAKREKLVDFTFRHDEQMCAGVMNIKAGQTIKMPERQAVGMQLNGHGTIGKVLKPHQHDQEAFDRFMKEEAATHHNPENDPKPGSNIVIGSRYARKPEGWYV